MFRLFNSRSFSFPRQFSSFHLESKNFSPRSQNFFSSSLSSSSPLRYFSSSSSSHSHSHSHTTPPIVLICIYFPRLSPSMEFGDLLYWHFPSNSNIPPNSLLFNLKTSQLLHSHSGIHKKSFKESEQSEEYHEMEIETADDGFQLQILRPGIEPRNKFLIPMENLAPPIPNSSSSVSSTAGKYNSQVENSKSIPVGTLIGYMFEDDPDEKLNEEFIKGISKKLREIFDIHNISNSNHRIMNGESSPALFIEDRRHFQLAHRRFETRPFIWQGYVKSGEKQTGSCTPQRSNDNEPDGI